MTSPELNAAKRTYWEAWPVRKGAIRTANRYDATDEGVTYDDSFDQPRRPGTTGTFQVMGLVKFFEGSSTVVSKVETRYESSGFVFIHRKATFLGQHWHSPQSHCDLGLHSWFFRYLHQKHASCLRKEVSAKPLS